MKRLVNMFELVRIMDMVTDDMPAYYDLQTGKIEVVDYYGTTNPTNTHLYTLIQEDDYSRFIPLPAPEDIDLYHIMMDFANLQRRPSVRSRMLSALQRKGAFKNFAFVLKDVRGEDQWYCYRIERLHLIAIQWCEDNRIYYYYKDAYI
ncbi:MAG: hypothetical protein J6S76_03555 [Clostridia bacterium]|nr:hypothetical protein [Clostridia bacterium]